MNVIVVESPTKARTIEKYLGSNYKVLSSFGHIRDLPPKDGSVDPDQNFKMIWAVGKDSEKQIKEIEKALKKADALYLASDPDREGEAIAWHVQEVLQERGALENVDVKRIVFHEITKKAIKASLDHPRQLNRELIDAYLARRALDYLVGFRLSPVLWRKLPGSRSAGRVQSVALRLIADREQEIEKFRPQEFWTIEGNFEKEKKLSARLTHLYGEKLSKFDISDEKSAMTAVAHLKTFSYAIDSIETKETKRHPQPPFTTSTLQQEASRKLGFGASRTMRIAQQLYEGISIEGDTTGLITYMRTDSVTVSQEALSQCRGFIEKSYGSPYLPPAPRAYKSKAKNAQEAHEAVRPTDLNLRPENIKHGLSEDQFKLYTLIWKRMVASQMESARFHQTAVDLKNGDKSVAFRATGSTLLFDGFLKLYEEGRDDASDEQDQKIPPGLNVGDDFDLKEILPEQHFTAPPPRYTEASLVKKLEELGIGRPSTYASIIKTLQDRNYVTLEKRRFHPEDRGRIVTAFLISYFAKYVEYDFTADLEEQLDDISGGRLNWQKVLKAFWDEFYEAIEATSDLRITQVIDQLEEDLGSFLFPEKEDGSDPRECPKCKKGRLGLKLGKFGAFLGCSNYPDCSHTQKLVQGDEGDEAEVEQQLFETKVLGTDPQTGAEISLRKGPYGFYFQWDEVVDEGAATKKKKKKPKRAALPKGKMPQDATLEMALDVGRLPREVGTHPETGLTITAAIGRFGPYLLHDKVYSSIPKEDDVLSVSLERSVEIIKEAAAKKAEKSAKKPAAKKR